MENIKISYSAFSRSILTIKDNPTYTYGVTLDFLFSNTTSGRSCVYVERFLIDNSPNIVSNQFEGIIDALLEYQISYPISNKLIRELSKYIFNKIKIVSNKDKKWINKGFILLQRSFSINLLNKLFDTAFMKEITSYYWDEYLKTVKIQIQIAKMSYPSFDSYSKTKIAMVRFLKDNSNFSDEYKNNFFPALIEILSEEIEYSSINATSKSKKIEIDRLNK